MEDSEEQNIKPTVILHKSFFQTTNGKTVLATGLGIILFVILVVSLNYFNVISISHLSFLPKRSNINLTGTSVKLTLLPENYGFKAGDLTLSCPVDSAFCKSQKLISSNNKDTVLYKAPSQASVSASIKVPGIENIGILTNKEKGKKYFYESVLSKDGTSCYTIAYTLPLDATFGDILNLPNLDKTAPIASLGTETFSVAGNEGNILIQVRNTPLDIGTPCSLIKKSPDFFKAFN